MQWHKGCVGQKHPSFPAAGQERTRKGSCTLRAYLRFLCQPRHKAACIQMCRQILAVPSPFWGCRAVASRPKGHCVPAAPSGSHLLLLAPVPSPSPKLRCI